MIGHQNDSSSAPLTLEALKAAQRAKLSTSAAPFAQRWLRRRSTHGPGASCALRCGGAGPSGCSLEQPVSSSYPLSLAHVCQAFHQGRQAMDQTQLRCQLMVTFLEKGLCPQEGPAWLGTLIPQGWRPSQEPPDHPVSRRDKRLLGH